MVFFHFSMVFFIFSMFFFNLCMVFIQFSLVFISGSRVVHWFLHGFHCFLLKFSFIFGNTRCANYKL
jgi:hypothetical protein